MFLDHHYGSMTAPPCGRASGRGGVICTTSTEPAKSSTKSPTATGKSVPCTVLTKTELFIFLALNVAILVLISIALSSTEVIVGYCRQPQAHIPLSLIRALHFISIGGVTSQHHHSSGCTTVPVQMFGPLRTTPSRTLRITRYQSLSFIKSEIETVS